MILSSIDFNFKKKNISTNNTFVVSLAIRLSAKAQDKFQKDARQSSTETENHEENHVQMYTVAS